MMDLVPENLDSAVVLNVVRSGSCNSGECRECSDIGGIVHNWLIQTDLSYLLLDLQDEKDVCETFLVEMLQLRKRLRFPMIFSGVMERSKKLLESYNYTTTLNVPLFFSPEEAITWIRAHKAEILKADLSLVQFGEAVVMSRIKAGLRAAPGLEGEDIVDDDSLEEAADL